LNLNSKPLTLGGRVNAIMPDRSIAVEICLKKCSDLDIRTPK